MRQLPLAAALLAPAMFAGGPETYKGSVYGYFNAGSCQHSYAIVGGGGGAEGFLWRGLTLGIEGGYQTFVNSFAFGDIYLPVGYHFNRRTGSKWDPFVSSALVGLYATRGGYGGAGHLGGGVTYWFKERWGIRTEFRVHALQSNEVAPQVRIGISFR